MRQDDKSVGRMDRFVVGSNGRQKEKRGKEKKLPATKYKIIDWLRQA